MSKQLDIIKSCGANISRCGLYRYRLWRRWGDGDHIAWIMLNPSTADALDDDPTIRRCTAFSREWGCEYMAVVNLFALRSTDPRNLKQASDPIGSDNYRLIIDACFDPYNKYVVAAWGAVTGMMRSQAVTVTEMLVRMDIELYSLGTTKDGHPRHPLYVPKNTPLKRWP